MAKIIKKNIDIILVAGIGLSLLMVTMIGIYQSIPMVSVSYVSAATDTEITVSATVQEWITLGVSTSSVALTPDLVDTSGNTSIASSSNITIAVGTNNAGGWHLSVQSANGKLTTSSYDILSCSVTSTISAGTDMYGLNATTSYGGVSIDTNYDFWGENIVGAASSTADLAFAEKSTGNSSTTVATIKILAACDDQQEAGTYADTLTITATGGT